VLLLGGRYVAGADGVVITWSDGSISRFQAWSVVHLEQRPRRIKGTLFPVRTDNALSFEAPDLVPIIRER